jgi:hypothetical protein
MSETRRWRIWVSPSVPVPGYEPITRVEGPQTPDEGVEVVPLSLLGDALEAMEAVHADDPALAVCARLPQPFYVADFVEAIDKADMTPQAANNSLARLVRLRLLDRERNDPDLGGKRYWYRLSPVAQLIRRGYVGQQLSPEEEE